MLNDKFFYLVKETKETGSKAGQREYRSMHVPVMVQYSPTENPLFAGKDPYGVSVADFLKFAHKDGDLKNTYRQDQAIVTTVEAFKKGRVISTKYFNKTEKIFLADCVVPYSAYLVAQQCFSSSPCIETIGSFALSSLFCSEIKYVAVMGDENELRNDPKKFFSNKHPMVLIDHGNKKQGSTVVLNHKTGEILFPSRPEGIKTKINTLGELLKCVR